MRHLWSTDGCCHHCGYDGAELQEAVKQGCSREALGGVRCPEGTKPNTKLLPEDEDWYDFDDFDYIP